MDDVQPYTRFGRIKTEGHSSAVVDMLEKCFPPDLVLPMRWSYRSHAEFMWKYGRPYRAWAHSTSSSLLLLHGQHILRVWTDARFTVVMDLNDTIAAAMAAYIPVNDLPATLLRKTKPLTKRVKLQSMDQVTLLVQQIRSVYGVDVARV